MEGAPHPHLIAKRKLPAQSFRCKHTASRQININYSFSNTSTSTYMYHVDLGRNRVFLLSRRELSWWLLRSDSDDDSVCVCIEALRFQYKRSEYERSNYIRLHKLFPFSTLIPWKCYSWVNFSTLHEQKRSELTRSE